jgi:4-hydroxy-tetrahydrodipicolinate reductase
VSEPIAVVLAGATGKTGSAVGKAIIQAPDMALVAAVAHKHAGLSLGMLWGEPAVDLAIEPELSSVKRVESCVLVDFTEPRSAYRRILEAIGRGWDVVVGTTGFDAEERAVIAQAVEANRVGACLVANFSLGAWVAEELAVQASRYFASAEIIEGHHETKRDRPSGTAKRMAGLLARSWERSPDDVPVHSLRLPGLVAHQAVVFGAPGQMLSIRHDVHDRRADAAGVLAAIRRVRSFRGRVVTNLGEILET